VTGMSCATKHHPMTGASDWNIRRRLGRTGGDLDLRVDSEELDDVMSLKPEGSNWGVSALLQLDESGVYQHRPLSI
jgi:hypothetical protein